AEPVPEEPRSEELPLDIFTFPRGAAAGTLLHEIFEELDFTGSEDSSLEELVAGKLQEHGFEQKWRNVLSKMVREVLCTPLDSNFPQLELRRIEQHDRLNELEFYFPLHRISKKELREIFSLYTEISHLGSFPEMIGQLNFAPAKGFMKGFIDLVFQFDGRFYLVDWKSNFLGDRIENYDEVSLNAAMINEMYILQYHIYSLALHRYLKLRVAGYDYRSHFGGVYYIFLRGVAVERGPAYGIYRDRPSLELLESLSQRLIEHKK
ncbi:MAG: PD-(D/E)XK nuclease family protein, partial [Desulfoferrobacter sp.]